MICFEIRLNGKKLYTVGIGEEGVMSSHLNWVHVPPEKRNPPQNQSQAGKPRLETGGRSANESLAWPTKRLKVGDEITFRIVDALPDEPKRHRVLETEDDRENRRRWYDAHKAEFEGE